MVAKPIFIGGTSSHAGKSWMTTAVCRWLVKRGFSVAPFKAQNMSNNSYPCAGGGEIGRAQVAQAEACRREPEPDMNPILLKPNSDTGSQVVLNGKVWRNLRAREYYEHHEFLRQHVLAAFERLSRTCEYIVIEGAGSVAEINLKRTDLANLSLAQETGARGLLVADIDRGGIFGALAGTMCVLEPAEREIIRSFAVNRFRGDPSLFEEGVNILEQKTGLPCLGVFPYAHDIHVDPEDGVSLEDAAGQSDIAILRFPHISNFTDFRLFPEATWVTVPIDREFQVVILPGTKNTLGDLAWMRARGLDRWVREQHAAGARVIGICGGYQMLGDSVRDDAGVESDRSEMAGLGLLPVTTAMRQEKTTRTVRQRTHGGVAFEAYEIHMGETTRPADAMPAFLPDEGIRIGRVCGTYLHGALENAEVASELLGREIRSAPSKESQYDALAAWFDSNANCRLFEEIYL